MRVDFLAVDENLQIGRLGIVEGVADRIHDSCLLLHGYIF